MERRKSRCFLLELLALSLYNGDDFMERDAEMNRKIYRMACEDDSQTKRETESQTGRAQSIRAPVRGIAVHEVLQGIRFAGLISGLYDGIYMKKGNGLCGGQIRKKVSIDKIRGRSQIETVTIHGPYSARCFSCVF